MVKQHMLRLSAPYSWQIPRKIKAFITRPMPGPHAQTDSMPLLVVCRDILKLADTEKEGNYVLKNKSILVDGKRRKEKKFPVGFMDVLAIKDLGKNFRVILDSRGKLRFKEISDAEAKFKLAKIVGVREIGKNKFQINLYDGKNFVSAKKAKLGDALVYDFEKGVGEVLELKNGAYVYLTAGNHTNCAGIVSEILPRKVAEDEIIIECKGEKIRTLKKHAYVIGKEKPYINVD